MAEAELAERFRKDPEEEAFLERLNAHLAPLEESLYRETEERLPMLHVVGVPRSGTTLVTQLLASHLDVGHISNFIAAFWRAPLHGIRLWQKLAGEHGLTSFRSNFRSEFGRTTGLAEPHEFGYFWRDLLGYENPLEADGVDPDTVDWGRVRLVLLNISEAFGRPVVFKSFHVAWHAGRLHAELPRSCFLRVRRDPVESALSLLRMRREFLGSVERWASFRPREYAWLRELPFWEQVAGQVHFLDRAIERQLSEVPATNVLEISYRALCADPPGVLDSVRALLDAHDAEVAIVGEPPEGFDRHAASARHPDHDRVSEALSRLQSESPQRNDRGRSEEDRGVANPASVADPSVGGGSA